MRAAMRTKIQQFLRYIFVGGLSLFPLILVLTVVNFIKELGLNAFASLNEYTDSFWVTVALIAAVIVIFAILGFSIEKYGKSMFVSIIDSMFEKIPAIRSVYSVSKKLAMMLSGGEEGGRKEVVLVEYPKEGVWVPAYLLNRHRNICVLFLPTSPNPTSGYTVIVDEKLTIKTTLTLQEASSFIISMGADFPKKEEIAEKVTNR
jgi:uncharacterized membrane protein